MDLLSGVFGILPAEMEKVCRRVYSIGDYRVIDPLYLFKGKCHNYQGLPQGGRNDGKHIAMLALVIPQHLAMLLSCAEDAFNPLTGRQVLREIKLLMKLTKDTCVKETMAEFGLTVNDLLPTQELKNSTLEQVTHFSSEL